MTGFRGRESRVRSRGARESLPPRPPESASGRAAVNAIATLHGTTAIPNETIATLHGTIATLHGTTASEEDRSGPLASYLGLLAVRMTTPVPSLPHLKHGRAEAIRPRPSPHLCPAVTYSPRPLPAKYHRRWRVSLPCSERERVVPRRYRHRTNLQLVGSRLPFGRPRPLCRSRRGLEHSIASMSFRILLSKPSAN